MQDFVEVIKKYGATGLLAVIVFWQNERINKVEQMLFDCYKERIYTRNSAIERNQLYAVLPERKKLEPQNLENDNSL